MDDLRVERTDEAYRGMLGCVDGGKKVAYSGAIPLMSNNQMCVSLRLDRGRMG